MKTYFFYDSQVASFHFERPKGCVQLGSIAWKPHKIELVICCSQIVLEKKRTWMKAKSLNVYRKKHMPILKSNLQKSIRRQMLKPAVRTAFTIACIDPNNLLRRLPIIMLEDVALTYDFITLIWLMCAVSKKKYTLSDVDITWLLSVVRRLVQCSQKEHYSKVETQFPLSKTLWDSLSTPVQQNMTWALELRKSYGGLKGDMKMVNWYTNKTIHTSDVNKWVLSVSETYPTINRFTPFLMTCKDILPSAVDFHCSNILYLLKRRFPLTSTNELKKMMWHNRSSINRRVKQHTFYKKERWDKTFHHVTNTFSLNIIKKMLL